VQSVGAFDGYLQLSKDGKYLYIFNNKSCRSPEYVYDPDHKAIAKSRKEFNNTLKRDPKSNQILDENFVEGVDFVSK